MRISFPCHLVSSRRALPWIISVDLALSTSVIFLFRAMATPLEFGCIGSYVENILMFLLQNSFISVVWSGDR